MGLLGGLRGEYTVAKNKSNGSTGEVLSTKTKVANVIIMVLLFLGAIVMVFPLIYMILMSLMTIRETISTTFVLIPEEWQWNNYVDIFSDSQFYNGVINSVIVAVPTLIIGCFTSSLAAFAFAKLRFRGKNVFFMCLLATMMIPFASIMIPQYVMFSKVGLLNTLLPLILPGALGNISVIFFLRQNLAGIPSTLVEAALIDGCGYFKIYYAIFLPLMKGSLATQAILWFMGIWNDYLAPQVFVGRTQRLYTLQLVIMKYFEDNATVANYPKIMTASVFSMLPTLILFFVFQRFIIESVALSGIKG